MTEVQCLSDTASDLGEGVFWHEAEAAVYWVDIMQSYLYRLTASGELESWHIPGQISAVVPCSSGGLLATLENGLVHIDVNTQTTRLIRPLETDIPDNRFNDGCSDSKGQLWFGSMDKQQQHKSGQFYRMNNAGEISSIPSFGKHIITNGPAISCDGHWVFYTDTMEQSIFRASILVDGSPGESEVHINFDDQPGYPDGMCTDTDNGLWVCHFGGSRVTRFTAEGIKDFHIDLPVPNPTKCAFGGKELQTLYITSATEGLDEQQRKNYPLSGGFFAVELSQQGIAMPAVELPESAT
ncbi:MAG: SMP-30/gluconolactonase/LRE family protein [Pseudomonadales bacterium]